ncbi:EexN family lipoprotein [Sphingopyxis sp.]|uniref:EexN family lipoprotein n=1 Tax=Sphingopyxis sp. TaxID=1908224 RepID=UPI002D7A308E|nr:EexN family lipoprotein [Sphingopyxis sp.]HET6523533.1 EexN family lipoprotein [Sphingopyxis sp.]
MKKTLVPMLVILGACSASEPRSTQFFEANVQEARAVIAACKEGSASGEECANADIAVQTVEGRERLKRFMGKQ